MFIYIEILILLSVAAPQFKKCPLRDVACLKNAIEDAIHKMENGLPEFGIGPLDPLMIPELKIGAGANVVHVEQHYRNVKINGNKMAQIDDVRFDFVKKEIVLTTSYSKLIMNADYNMMGRILVLPVFGNGKCQLILDNPRPILKLKFDIVTKHNGKKYIVIKDQEYTLNPSFASYHFENLFNGDKMLGEQINKVLNENWKEIFEEVGPGYEKAMGMLLANIANRVFSKVAINELFLADK